MDYYTAIFERVESKYILTKDLYLKFMELIKDYVKPTDYPHCEIKSIYFDSDDYRLIRTSLDKPAYKEKLRLRCYGDVDNDTEVFMEIKKKYHGVTYKRRERMSYLQAKNYMMFEKMPFETQIMKEIDYMRNAGQQLNPKVLIGYSRDCWQGIKEEDLRITFDTNIRFNLDDLTLTSKPQTKLTDDNTIILEIKTNTTMPLWLTNILTELNIYPASFSKYGNIYQKYIMKGEKKWTTYSRQYSQAHSMEQALSYAQLHH